MEGDSSRFQELLNSKPFDVHRYSHYPQVNNVVKNIYEEFKQVGILKNNSKATFNVIKALICDLYVTHQYNPSVYTAVSRNKNSYKKGDRYSSLHIGSDPMIRTLDGLQSIGYIEENKGFHDRNSGRGFQTRIKATDSLLSLFDKNNVEVFMIEKNPDREVIILRDENKDHIQYEDTDHTRRMRNRVKHINKHLSAHLIDIALRDDDFNTMLIEMSDPNTDYTPVIDLLNDKYLYRVFNNSSWDQGGRFYGAFWQQIPSDFRQYITVDDKLTVEVDYSSFHPRLLYHSLDYIAPADPYQINSELSRSQVKRLFNIMLNSNGRAKAISAMLDHRNMTDEDKELNHVAVNQAMDKILEQNSVIKDAFFRGYGLQLMFIDSMIAEEIMLRAISEYNTVVLPVHDSFICAEGFESTLIDLMTDAYMSKIDKQSNRQPEFKTKKCSLDDEKLAHFQHQIVGKARERNDMLRRAAYGNTNN